MLTSVSSSTLQVCSSGGRVIKHGLDNGDGSGTAQNGILEAGEVDYTTIYCSNFVLTRMADLNSGSGSGSLGTYAHVTVMGSRLYFVTNDGSSGYELWAHETANGLTWQVADINSGSSGSNPGYYAGLTVMGTRLYFDAKDGSSGHELWVHETTNGLTWQVADINSGSGSYPGVYAGVTVMGTRLYFDADDGSSGYELWRMEIEHTTTYN
jgi:ELWxxDGT repeat protein